MLTASYNCIKCNILFWWELPSAEGLLPGVSWAAVLPRRNADTNSQGQAVGCPGTDKFFPPRDGRKFYLWLLLSWEFDVREKSQCIFTVWTELKNNGFSSNSLLRMFQKSLLSPAISTLPLPCALLSTCPSFLSCSLPCCGPSWHTYWSA